MTTFADTPSAADIRAALDCSAMHALADRTAGTPLGRAARSRARELDRQPVAVRPAAVLPGPGEDAPAGGA